MEYECCECKRDFPAEAAVDGFKEGYRVGFLCPLCGVNLQDNLVDTHWLLREGRGFSAGLIAYGALGVFAHRLAQDVPWGYWAIYLLVLSAAVIYGFKRYPALFVNGVRSTRLGPGKQR